MKKKARLSGRRKAGRDATRTPWNQTTRHTLPWARVGANRLVGRRRAHVAPDVNARPRKGLFVRRRGGVRGARRVRRRRSRSAQFFTNTATQLTAMTITTMTKISRITVQRFLFWPFFDSLGFSGVSKCSGMCATRRYPEVLFKCSSAAVAAAVFHC